MSQNPKITTSPEAEVAKAKLTTGSVASDNALLFTAKEPGTAGNDISVALVDPGGTTAALGVTVAGKAITVNLERAASALASTADQVSDAINAHSDAKALIAASTAVGDSNGTGLVAAVAKTNLAGGQESKVSHVETTSVIKDPTDPKAVQIPPEADATGRDELKVHEGQSPTDIIGAM